MFIIFWQPTYGKRYHGRPRSTYPDVIYKKTGLDKKSVQEVMLDRDKWREVVANSFQTSVSTLIGSMSAVGRAVGQAARSWRKLMMCRPTEFDVIHEGHNAYMTLDKPVDRKLAMEQWSNLKKTFESIGTSVEVIDNAPGQVDQVFTANCALVWNGKALISRMFNEPRRAESDITLQWFKDRNFEVYDSRPHGIHLEGCGDFAYNYDRKNAYLGYGFRSDKDAYDLVKDVIDFTGTEFHSLKLVSELCYHLDTAMLNLSQGHTLVFKPAFDKESYQLIKEVNGEENIIEIGEEDCVGNFVPNAIPVQDGDKHYIVGMAFSPQLEHKLRDLGYEILISPYQEFKKSGGSIRCSVLDIGI